MPVKKKPAQHFVKKKPTAKETSETTAPKKERPVMQVVQVEGEEVSPTQPAQEVTVTPPHETAPLEEKILPVTEPTVVSPVSSPVVVGPDTNATADSAIDTTVEEKPSSDVISAAKETATPTNVVTAKPAPTPSETFLEGLPDTSSSSKKGLIIILVLLLLILVGGVGGYIYWKQGGKLMIPQKISFPAFMTGSSTKTPPSVTPTTIKTTPTPTPVDKSAYTIEVLNGSGVRGEAARVKDSLTTGGYTVSGTGNADGTNYTQTEIKAKASVSQAFLTALMNELSKTYSVSSSTVALSASATTDVVVIIGSGTAK